MKKRGRVIYFGKEMDDYEVEVREGAILINGQPLVPSYSTLDLGEESEFMLDDKTQNILEESLKILDPALPFEDNAERVATYLKERGLTVRRGEFYGDVLLETSEGWGVVVLFNEEARIEKSKLAFEELEPGKPPSNLEELFKEGLVIVDKGLVSLIPEEEAEEIMKRLEKVYASKEDSPTKIRKIQEILGIPEESARNLLMQHRST